MLKVPDHVDFEFTLALNNATGKYFLCQDAIAACDDATISFHMCGIGACR
jgi:hypothetical protein